MLDADATAGIVAATAHHISQLGGLEAGENTSVVPSLTDPGDDYPEVPESEAADDTSTVSSLTDKGDYPEEYDSDTSLESSSSCDHPIQIIDGNTDEFVRGSLRQPQLETVSFDAGGVVNDVATTAAGERVQFAIDLALQIT